MKKIISIIFLVIMENHFFASHQELKRLSRAQSDDLCLKIRQAREKVSSVNSEAYAARIDERSLHYVREIVRRDTQLVLQPSGDPYEEFLALTVCHQVESEKQLLERIERDKAENEKQLKEAAERYQRLLKRAKDYQLASEKQLREATERHQQLLERIERHQVEKETQLKESIIFGGCVFLGIEVLRRLPWK